MTSLVLNRPDSFHPLVDEPELDRFYGDADVVACGQPRAGSHGPAVVSGPFDYWYLRRCRQRAAMCGPDGGNQIATDVFLWSLEQPRHPATTKLGGLPYLPRDRPWPTRDGVVGTFEAQLCFSDSLDLVPFVPAELLLVFKFNLPRCTSWDRECYEFVWVDIDDGRPRHNKADVPAGGISDEAELHGVRVRSCDEPTLIARIRSEDLPHVHAIIGTKIGGAPSDRQSIDQPETPPDWRFLGQIAGTWPANAVACPVFGHAQGVLYGTPEYYRLMHGPGDGINCLYLDGNEAVQVYFSGG